MKMIIISIIKLTWILQLLEQFFCPVVSVCNWPAALQDGVWIDSDKGSLTFNATHMFGWRLKTVVSSTVVTDWVCQNSTGDYIVARASTDIDPLKSSFIAFLCLKMTQISNYSFYYYQHSAEQLNSNGERFAITFSSNFISFISDLRNICTETPATSEFHMLLKQGFQNGSKVYCPDAFLGMFSYTFNNGSTTMCGNHTELWDVCSDRKVMTFNYNACTALIAYSALGRVYCVNSLTSGGYYYAAVYNTDPTVDSYRFTCLMGSLSGNDVYVSQSPRSCTKTQTTTSIPVTANATSLGAFMHLTAYNTCRFESPSTSGSTTPNIGSTVGGATTNVGAIVGVATPNVGVATLNVGAIVGGTVGGLVLLAALVGAVILFYLCVLRKTSTKKLLEEDDTNLKIAERKQSTLNKEDKRDNSRATVLDKRSDGTWGTEGNKISSRTVEQKENTQKSEEKITFIYDFLFSKEGTGLDVTQQPPTETIYRQNPILDTDRSTVVVAAENVPDNESNTNAPITDGKSPSIIVTLADNRTRTMGNASPLVCISPSPLLEKALALSISKDNHEDESNCLTPASTQDASFTFSIKSSRPRPFSERDISTEPLPEYSDTDSACESGDEDSGQDTSEAEKDQAIFEKLHPTHGYISFTGEKKFAKHSVSVFDKYGGHPPLGFDSPKNKSLKPKRRRKKKRKDKAKLVSFRSPSTVRKSSLRTTSRLSGVSSRSEILSSDMSISENSVMPSAQKDSPVSDNEMNNAVKETAQAITEQYRGAPGALTRNITAAVIEDLKRKGLISSQLGNANPNLYGEDIRIRGNKPTITKPATPTTSTGLGEVTSFGQGPVTIDIP